MNTIEGYSNYLFVFAHPDDEVYTCGLMHQLVEDGKAVTAAFITTGDAGANPELRESEVKASMSAIGVSEEHTLLLDFSERKVLSSFPRIIQSLNNMANKVRPDCVIGMDYEGGHEVHDSTSFLTSLTAAELAVNHYVFPVYHTEGDHRKAAVFIPGRIATDTIGLTAEDVGIKIRVLEAHRGQIGHFLHLQRQSPGYFERLFSREVFRKILEPTDYSQRPTSELGYESHKNGVKFTDFQVAVASFNK